MAHYMVQASYTTDSWKELTSTPANRAEAVGRVIESMGGRVEGFWFSFGDYDVVGIVEMPDDVTAAAFAFAVSAGGGVSGFKTTHLLTADEAMAAMAKAGGTGYSPPGS